MPTFNRRKYLATHRSNLIYHKEFDVQQYAVDLNNHEYHLSPVIALQVKGMLPTDNTPTARYTNAKSYYINIELQAKLRHSVSNQIQTVVLKDPSINVKEKEFKRSGVEDKVKEIIERIIRTARQVNNKGGSGFNIISITHAIVDIKPNNNVRLTGAWIPTPDFLKGKVINVKPKKEDKNLCFYYSVINAINQKSTTPLINKAKVTSEESFNKYFAKQADTLKPYLNGHTMPELVNTFGAPFDISLSNIQEFENLTNLKLKILIAEIATEDISVYYENESKTDLLTLLVILSEPFVDTDTETEVINYHTTCLSTNAFISSDKYHCPYCNYSTNSERYFKEHQNREKNFYEVHPPDHDIFSLPRINKTRTNNYAFARIQEENVLPLNIYIQSAKETTTTTALSDLLDYNKVFIEDLESKKHLILKYADIENIPFTVKGSYIKLNETIVTEPPVGCTSYPDLLHYQVNCQRAFRLDPLSFNTVAKFALDSFVHNSQYPIHLITDPEIMKFVNQCKHGPLAYMLKKYHNFKATNTYSISLDHSQLYPSCARRRLPYSDFKFCDLTLETLRAVRDDSKTGYIAEIDWELPETAYYYNQLCQWPLFRNEANVPVIGRGTTTEHYKLIQLADKLGYRITIKRAIRFTQKAVLRDYVKKCNALRKQGVPQAKQIANSLIGKLYSNPNYHKVKVISNDPEEIERNFYDRTLVKSFTTTGDKVILEKNLEHVVNYYPFHYSIAILSLSRYTMAKFVHKFLFKHFENLELIYSDTDSMIASTTTNPQEVYDRFPEYINDSKDLGTVHIEHRDIEEFVAIRPKLYSLRCSNHDVSKTAINNTFDDFMDCLNGKTVNGLLNAERNYKETRNFINNGKSEPIVN